MESGGKTPDGRYDLWVVAASLLGQLPTNEEDGKAVLNLMGKLFEEFKQNSIHDTKLKRKNETKQQKGERTRVLKLVETTPENPIKE